LLQFCVLSFLRLIKFTLNLTHTNHFLMLGKYKPSSLRGNFERSRFFEGWFQKVFSKQHNASFLLIYGYATRNSNDKFGFLQVLIPNQPPLIVYFPKDEVSCHVKSHVFRMGNNIFTTESIRITTSDLGIDLNLTNNHPIKSFKNSMGYAYYIPNLPCYHSVLNTSQIVFGEIRHKGEHYVLENEMGYLEKNWGISFPESYFWVHAVDPTDPNISLLFSRAEIVWLGKIFIKHVGHLRFDGKQIDLRELKNFTFSNIIDGPENQTIQIRSVSIQLDIGLGFGTKVHFQGPNDGELSRAICHQSDAKIEVSLTWKNTIRSFQMVGNFENIGLL
jgi:tocopherol cyclase